VRKCHGHISWVRALGFILFKEDPPNLYKIESALESDKWSLNGWLWNMTYFPKIYTIYIEKEQIAGPKKDNAMRKSHGHISWVRARGFILCKEDPPNLYKIESALESDKWSLNGWLWNMVYFPKIYTIYIKNKSPVQK
jgi:hypothetical protein